MLGQVQAAAPAGAQTRQAVSSEQLIDWYFGAVFGTGVYRSGDRTVSVLQIPFSHELRPMTPERFGVKINVPVSFGFYDYRFDELVNGDTPHSVSTGSVFPGVELAVQATDNWILRPYANVGRGWEFSGSEAAWIYAVGVKSLVGLPIGGNSRISLGNQLTLSGYRPDGEPNRPLGLFVTGINLEIPTRLTLYGQATRVGCHLIYYYYFKRLTYPHFDDLDNKVAEQAEIAVSLSTPQPVSFKLFDLDRVGLAFQVGGGIQAVRLFFNLPY
jgi:hypothetical protein